MPIPQVGQPAPDFELPDETGQIRHLDDYRGSKLILFFYPEDDTPGCTTEVCGLRDDYAQFKQAGVQILGVSPDSAASHADFKSKFSLPFSLLADEQRIVLNAYGVWGEKQLFGHKYEGVKRTTFVIDEEGQIEHVFENVQVEKHTAQLLSALGLQTP